MAKKKKTTKKLSFDKKKKVEKNEKPERKASSNLSTGKVKNSKKKELKKKNIDKTTKKAKKPKSASKKKQLPGKLAMADKIRSGYLVKVVHLSPDGKRNFTTQGVVLRVRGEQENKTFTVRSKVAGVVMEKVFSFASPALKEVEILKKKLARRARLYFLRSDEVSSTKKTQYLKGL